MLLQRLKSLGLLLSLSAALYGCASFTPQPQVGTVVEAPKVTRPPIPTLVLETQPKPTGYFQRETLDALSR